MRRDNANSARKMCYTGGMPHIAKWNRHAAFFILSAHPHGQVCLWDLRVSFAYKITNKFQKPSAPISTIFASTSHISSIDWSFTDSSQFVTTDSSTKVKVSFVSFLSYF